MRGVLDLEKMLEREKDEEEDDLGVYFCRSKFMFAYGVLSSNRRCTYNF